MRTDPSVGVDARAMLEPGSQDFSFDVAA